MFNNYPYTDFHELNADWLIKTIIELTKKLNEFVALNTVKYADPMEWDITKQYEMNTVVMDPETLTAYISTKPVPSGVDITNTDYWTPVFDLGIFIEKINQAFTSHDEGSGSTATSAYSKGDWIWINNTLHIALEDIAIGSAFVTDGNVKEITVEDMVETIYYPNDKKLSLHSKISDYSQIVTRGEYHIFNPQREAIEIREVE